jgi:hypothetical protein
MSWHLLSRCALALSLVSVLTGTGACAAELSFDLRIENGRVPANMRLLRVAQGDVVKLRWTADRATILHLHGYDIELTVNPGTVADMSFTARATGRFPVSVHTPQGGGGHTHEPPLLHVEVHPR